MSSFTTPAILEMLEHYKWREHEPFVFWLTSEPDDVIEVPAGFVTDLTTIPCIFWVLLSPDGKCAKAAIIHGTKARCARRKRPTGGMTVLGAKVEEDCDVLGSKAVWLGEAREEGCDTRQLDDYP